MKKKTSLQPFVLGCSLLVTAFFACILQAGCNNKVDQAKETAKQGDDKPWITMDITFEPNTTEESREQAIRDIEKMWIREAAPFTKQTANLYPSISVVKFPFLDTLKYRISLLNTYFGKGPSGDPKPMSVMSAPRPPCPPCPGLCPACDSVKSFLTKSYSIATMVFDEAK